MPCRSASLGLSDRDCAMARAWDSAAVLARCLEARAPPTQPMRMPAAVRRWSALSARSVNRYSARDVNIRSGSLSRIEPGDQALPRRFLVPGRAVDLAGQEQAHDALGLQRRLKLSRIDMVVFDGVAGPHHLRALEPGNRRQQLPLHFFRQRRRDSVGIDRRIVQALGLEKNLMSVALAEADDFVLDRRTIARTAAADLARIHRRAVYIGADDLVGRRVGPRDSAANLRVFDAFGEYRKRLGGLVSGLHFEPGPFDRAPVEPRRRPGLQAAEREAEMLERACKADCPRTAGPLRRLSTRNWIPP